MSETCTTTDKPPVDLEKLAIGADGVVQWGGGEERSKRAFAAAAEKGRLELMSGRCDCLECQRAGAGGRSSGGSAENSDLRESVRELKKDHEEMWESVRELKKDHEEMWKVMGALRNLAGIDGEMFRRLSVVSRRVTETLEELQTGHKKDS